MRKEATNGTHKEDSRVQGGAPQSLEGVVHAYAVVNSRAGSVRYHAVTPQAKSTTTSKKWWP
jgi:hypothetical protein